METSKTKKPHRDRKSPGSREHFQKLRRARNASRPKQRWIGGESVTEGGCWTREA